MTEGGKGSVCGDSEDGGLGRGRGGGDGGSQSVGTI